MKPRGQKNPQLNWTELNFIWRILYSVSPTHYVSLNCNTPGVCDISLTVKRNGFLPNHKCHWTNLGQKSSGQGSNYLVSEDIKTWNSVRFQFTVWRIWPDVCLIPQAGRGGRPGETRSHCYIRSSHQIGVFYVPTTTFVAISIRSRISNYYTWDATSCVFVFSNLILISFVHQCRRHKQKTNNFFHCGVLFFVMVPSFEAWETHRH